MAAAEVVANVVQDCIAVSAMANALAALRARQTVQAKAVVKMDVGGFAVLAPLENFAMVMGVVIVNPVVLQKHVGPIAAPGHAVSVLLN
jgi:hypothetical protein